jgi:ATP-binding cassette subfamily F protein uup
MDKIVDHLFIFKGQGKVEDFPGNYSDYRSYEDSKPPVSKSKDAPKEKQSWKKNTSHVLSYNEQKEYKNIESKLKSLEFDKKLLEDKFLNPDLTQEDIFKLSKEVQKIVEIIEEKEMRWMELAEKLEG